MENISLKTYFKDVRKLELVSGDEQISLAIKAKKGDDKALKKLVEANLRFVVSVAKDYRYSGIPLEDLVNEGNIGLIRAIKKFDETKGNKVISYAVWWIRQAIIQSIYDNSNIVRLPVNRINMHNKIVKAKEKLEKNLRREPTTLEISKETKMSEKDIKLSFSGCNHGLSFNEGVSEDSSTTFEELAEGDGFIDIEKHFNRCDVTSEIDSVLASLSDRESKILRMYFGLGEYHEMTLKEIGGQLSLTNERVRQIKDSALKKMRMYGNCSKLREFLNYEL